VRNRYRYLSGRIERLPVRTSTVDLEACVSLRLIEVDIEIGLERVSVTENTDCSAVELHNTCLLRYSGVVLEGRWLSTEGSDTVVQKNHRVVEGCSTGTGTKVLEEAQCSNIGVESLLRITNTN
jgi:hypothetical protein